MKKEGIKPTRWQLVSAGWVSVFFIGLSFFMLYLANFTNTFKATQKHYSGNGIAQINVLFGIVLLLGIWGSYRLTQIFKFTVFYNNTNYSTKKAILGNVIKTLDLKVVETYEDGFKLYYWKNIFSRGLNVIILIDSEGFYINVLDLTSFSLDFGAYARMRTKIKNEIDREINSLHYA